MSNVVLIHWWSEWPRSRLYVIPWHGFGTHPFIRPDVTRLFWLIYWFQPYVWLNATWLIKLIIWQSQLITVCMVEIPVPTGPLSRYSGDTQAESGAIIPILPLPLTLNPWHKKTTAPLNFNQHIWIREILFPGRGNCRLTKCLYVKRESSLLILFKQIKLWRLKWLYKKPCSIILFQ